MDKLIRSASAVRRQLLPGWHRRPSGTVPPGGLAEAAGARTTDYRLAIR